MTHDTFLGNSDSGKVFVELALVLPIILLIGFGGLEFSRSLKYTQVAETLSREMAHVAFRQCSALSTAECNACLETNVRAPLTSFGTSALGPMDLLVSVYRFEGGVLTRACSAGSTGRSLFSENEDADKLVGPNYSFTQAEVNEHQLFVVGEAYVSYTPVINVIPGIFRYNVNEFYASVVF